MRRWNRLFLEWYGTALPDDYLVFDLETTGLKRDWALPIDFGWAVVRAREIVNQGNMLLNWSEYPGVERDWLFECLRKIQQSMAKRGKNFPYTVDLLERRGKPPEKVLGFAYELFRRNRQAKASFVGHNAWFFDSELITHVFGEACGLEWEFGGNELFDTGGMEKAMLANLIPYPDETTLKEYFLRVHHNYQPGIKWNIEACVLRHDLEERYGISLSELHGNAGLDAKVAHLLLEEHRVSEG